MPNVFEKICAVEFHQLPESVKQVYLSPPVISVPVEPIAEGFKLKTPEVLDKPAQEALMPKLGIKSWRDSGSLGVIYAGVNMRSVAEILLQKITAQQRLTASAWSQTQQPLHLHLSPYVDFSGITEARFLTSPGQCRRISFCLRGQSLEGFNTVFPQLSEFAAAVAKHLPPYSHIIELAYLTTGQIRLIEINPGLTQQDIAVLQKI